MPNPTIPNKQGRYYANIAPYYLFQLAIEAWLKNRSLAEEAGSLLQAKLGERAAKRDEMLATIAAYLKISKEKLIEGILDGSIDPNLSQLTEQSEDAQD